MSEQQSWRAVLRRVLADQKKRGQVAKEMQTHIKTLERWMRDETSKPSSMKLNQLLDALPEIREELVPLLRADFPDFKPLVQPDTVLKEISVEFYAQVHEAYATTAYSLHFWTLCQLILRQIMLHLERDASANFQIVIVQCMKPADAYAPVRSLHECAAMGTSPFSRHLELHASYFLGIESLSGYVVSRGNAAVIQDAKADYPRIPVHWDEQEMSAAGYPIVKADKIAGCLRVSADQPYFFTDRIKRLLHYYSRLIALAFPDDAFYERSRFRLETMPYYKEQDPHLARLQTRIATCQHEMKCTYEQAEHLVHLELEEELRRLASTSPLDGGNNA